MFEPRRRRILKRGASGQQQLDAGELPDFPAETAEIREAPLEDAPSRRPICRTAASRSPARPTAR